MLGVENPVDFGRPPGKDGPPGLRWVRRCRRIRSTRLRSEVAPGSGTTVGHLGKVMNLKLRMQHGAFHKPITVLIQVFCACYWVVTGDSQINLDLRKGLIGTISVMDTLDQLKIKLGALNVQPYTGRSEGEEYRGYKLKFRNSQTVDANQAYLEIKSTGFRTRTGLGVGSTWKDFREAFSDGDLMWAEDAKGIWSEKFKF